MNQPDEVRVAVLATDEGLKAVSQRVARRPPLLSGPPNWRKADEEKLARMRADAAKIPPGPDFGGAKLTDHAPYAEALEQLRQVDKRLQNAQSRVTEIRGKLSQHAASVDDLTRRAREVLAGSTPTDVGQLRSELEELEKTLPVLKRAVELQTFTVQERKNAANRAFCERVRADHARVSDRFAKAALELFDAAVDEQRFANALMERGVDFVNVLPRACFPGCLGYATDAYGALPIVIRNLINMNLIKPEELPAFWRGRFPL